MLGRLQADVCAIANAYESGKQTVKVPHLHRTELAMRDNLAMFMPSWSTLLKNSVCLDDSFVYLSSCNLEGKSEHKESRLLSAHALMLSRPTNTYTGSLHSDTEGSGLQAVQIVSLSH